MIENFDELISERDEDYFDSGILRESIIRLSFLSVIQSKIIVGSIGNISTNRHQKLLHRLSDYLINKSL